MEIDKRSEVDGSLEGVAIAHADQVEMSEDWYFEADMVSVPPFPFVQTDQPKHPFVPAPADLVAAAVHIRALVAVVRSQERRCSLPPPHNMQAVAPAGPQTAGPPPTQG